MKVSIITVTYNSGKYLSSAINSVISQHHPDIEYIIVDGGSQDNTVSLIKSFGSSVTHFISEPDGGIYDAMNKGITLASGDVICFLNSDDFYIDSFVISDVVKLFEQDKKIDIVLGNVDYVFPHDLNKPIRTLSSYSFSPYKMRFGFMPAHPGAFVRRPRFIKVGLFDISYKIAADFEWFVRAFHVFNLHCKKLNKTLVRMRMGGVSTAGISSTLIITSEMNRALRENSILSSFLLVSLRLPIKLFQKLFFR